MKTVQLLQTERVTKLTSLIIYRVDSSSLYLLFSRLGLRSVMSCADLLRVPLLLPCRKPLHFNKTAVVRLTPHSDITKHETIVSAPDVMSACCPPPGTIGNPVIVMPLDTKGLLVAQPLTWAWQMLALAPCAEASSLIWRGVRAGILFKSRAVFSPLTTV